MCEYYVDFLCVSMRAREYVYIHCIIYYVTDLKIFPTGQAGELSKWKSGT